MCAPLSIPLCDVTGGTGVCVFPLHDVTGEAQGLCIPCPCLYVTSLEEPRGCGSPSMPLSDVMGGAVSLLSVPL